MKIEAKNQIEKMVNKKSVELSLEKEKINQTSDSIIPIFREHYHLFSMLKNPIVPPLEIQCSISIEKDFVRALWFPHPQIITEKTINEFFSFANEANRQAYTGIGRFWCDEEEKDFAYEICCNEEIIENCPKIAEKQLFDFPYSHFVDLHTPLLLLASNKWKADTAIRYLIDLRTNRYVDNSKYGLW